jgi:hypothetical protein
MWPSPVKAREWGSRNQQFNSAHPDHFYKGLCMDEESWRTNRVKKTEPLPDKSSWCNSCDAEIVREGERCPVCGHKDVTKHRKP